MLDASLFVKLGAFMVSASFVNLMVSCSVTQLLINLADHPNILRVSDLGKYR